MVGIRQIPCDKVRRRRLFWTAAPDSTDPSYAAGLDPSRAHRWNESRQIIYICYYMLRPHQCLCAMVSSVKITCVMVLTPKCQAPSWTASSPLWISNSEFSRREPQTRVRGPCLDAKRNRENGLGLANPHGSLRESLV